ncbi:glycosyl hydrolase catalytic core domain-containing protein [Rhizoctonia solani AG-1 IA]|uniref:Glycosyl hydrolase catalytic core domain-containing protein n=1 Tax=Thanatephorus cucumeris (strain AG1-IA) TaxID=983506 RepID=L8WYH5_THACA|nr:glycosyl hydrolase catalytic core domain-containing protein [Rhizoctonia solani AG-1 IA]
MAVMSRLLPLFGYSTFAIFLLVLIATPTDALVHEPRAHVARGHDAIAKRKRNPVKRAKRCRPQTSTLVSASATPTSSSTPAPATTSSYYSAPAESTPEPTTKAAEPTTSQAPEPTTSEPASTSQSVVPAPISTSVSIGGGSSGGSTGLDPNKKLLLAWTSGPTDLEKFAYGSRVGGVYTWSPYNPDTTGKLGIRFLPMLWGTKQKSSFTEQVKSVTDQSNMSAADGAALWKSMILPLKAKGAKLISPATTSAPSGKQWIQDMMNACGEDQCQPLIISEYACQDFSGGPQCTKQQTETFHYTMGAWFDQHEGVAMYSPFGFMKDMGNVNPDNQLMNQDGTPNNLGRIGVFLTVIMNARVLRDIAARKGVAATEITRRAYLFVARNQTLPPQIRYQAQLQLNSFSKYTRPNSIKNRCTETGRGRGIISKFGLCRHRGSFTWVSASWVRHASSTNQAPPTALLLSSMICRFQAGPICIIISIARLGPHSYGDNILYVRSDAQISAPCSQNTMSSHRSTLTLSMPSTIEPVIATVCRLCAGLFTHAQDPSGCAEVAPTLNSDVVASGHPDKGLSRPRLTLYGHIGNLAQSIKKGAESEGVEVTLFQVYVSFGWPHFTPKLMCSSVFSPETLSPEVLTKLGAPPRNPDIPTITAEDMKQFDGFAFGIPTRYGRAPAQISAFFDTTGSLWFTQALHGKFATVFVSTGTQHGGQETTTLTTMPFFAHHGINYVPIGYKSPLLGDMSGVQAGGPFGSATMAGSDGSRQATSNELAIAEYQGKHFAEVVKTYERGKAAA